MIPFDLRRLGKQILPVLLLVLSFACATSASGQATSTGTVVGTVTDPSGAVVPGVVITLTDLSTNEVRSEKTTKTGQYIAVNMPPGEYSITATKDGFSKGEVPHVTVS